ncbi:pseudouridine synthase [Sphingomonas oligophenolica]|uniref:Pseudouridine synthase n=1 Tax=Sphingomonas oligophenolica TaxID=301154 RepID=A0A502CIB3_9SPHN|nr:pseudouridine synthase [Sphingomonas oligophenolica]
MPPPTDDKPTGDTPTDAKPTDAKPTDAKPGHRIAKLLARAGVASRREIERMIADGRVALDGVVLDTPATILRTLAGVTVDGQPVAAAEATRLFLYHKPTGLLVTEHDPAGRPTIYDRLPQGLPRLVPVGRLDFNTEGLLLLTTDGGLKRQLELPSTGVERAYRARTYGRVSQTQLEDLADGIEIEGMRYGSINANMERRTGANAWIEMILTEGKNREVRRVLEHLELEVSRLIRTRYGPFLLGDLAPGEIGEVKQNDLVNFRKWLDSPKRGNAADEPVVTVDARKPPPRPATPTSEPQGRLRVARAPRAAPVRPPATRDAPADRTPRDDAPPSFQKRGSPRPPLGAKQTSRSAAGRPGAAPRPESSNPRPPTRPTRPTKGPADGRGRPPRGKR